MWVQLSNPGLSLLERPQSQKRPSHVVQPVLPGHGLSSAGTDLLAVRCVADETLDRIRQAPRLSGRDQHAVQAMGDDVRRSSEIGGDHRGPQSHAFDDDPAERLRFDAGVYEDIQSTDEVQNISSPSHPVDGRANRIDLEPASKGLVLGGRLADDHEVAIRGSVAEQASSANESFDPFPRSDGADVTHHWADTFAPEFLSPVHRLDSVESLYVEAGKP